MRPDNQIIVDEFASKVKEAESIFVTSFVGLNQEEFVKLREKLDECSAEHRVLKNRIFKIISRKAEISDAANLEPMLKGSSSFTIGGDDVVSVAKVIADFAKDHENFTIKGAIVDGKILSEKDVKVLASLPSKQELIAKVVGSIAAPLSGIVGVLAANLRNIVGVISAIKDKKESIE